MKNVKPCPRCKGEVEVIKLKNEMFRLQCRKCGYTVAKGKKFPEETKAEGEERIKQYYEYLEHLYPKMGGLDE